MKNINKMIAFGDSITAGWNGLEFVNSWVTTVNEVLNKKIDNRAFNGSTLSFRNSAHNFNQQVNDTSVLDYDLATIMFGTNDFIYYGSTLDEMKTSLKKGIENIINKNPGIVLIGILPIQSWETAADLDSKNSAGFSQNDMMDLESEIFIKYHIPVLDWRKNPVVTNENHQDFLGDGDVHPNANTYVLLGREIANFVKIKGDLPIIQYSDDVGRKAYAYTNWNAINNKPEIISKEDLQSYAMKSDLPKSISLTKGTIALISGLPTINYAYNDKLVTISFIGQMANTVTNMQGDMKVGVLTSDIPKPPFDVTASLVDISNLANIGHLKVQSDGILIINMTNAWNGDWISGTVSYAV